MVVVEKPWPGSEVTYQTENNLSPIILLVPQGSVLGPLLFIIYYISDICDTYNIISFCLFADDTSLVYSYNDVDESVKKLNTELVKISDWLLANKLCINTS